MSTTDSTPNTEAPRVPGGTAPRRVVGSYETYAEAERAVDFLSDSGFPVERTAIVGRNPQIVEQVTGRMTTATQLCAAP